MTVPTPPNQASAPFTHREQQDTNDNGNTSGKRSSAKGSLTRLAIGYALTSALLIWTGPFSTYDLFPLVIRIFYWGLINLAAWLLTASLAIGIEQFLKKRMQPLTKRMEVTGAFLAGCMSATPLAFIVVMANRLTLPYSTNPQAINSLPDFLSLLSHIAPLTILISVLYTLWHHRQSSADQPGLDEALVSTTDTEQPKSISSPFLDRLPKHLGRDLLWLSSQDHYLEVKTIKGKDLILMRLGDAVKELEDYAGARIHRSHWVADAAVERIETREGRLFVHLNDETCLPISRTYRQVPSQRSWSNSRK